MSNEVVDVEGTPIVAGDRVAGAFRIGNTARLRTGTVLGFGERGNKLTVRVHWTQESYYNGSHEVDIVGGIEAKLVRFVKIGHVEPEFEAPAESAAVQVVNP